jgi:hypothetical protein
VVILLRRPNDHEDAFPLIQMQAHCQNIPGIKAFLRTTFFATAYFEKPLVFPACVSYASEPIVFDLWLRTHCFGKRMRNPDADGGMPFDVAIGNLREQYGITTYTLRWESHLLLCRLIACRCLQSEVRPIATGAGVRGDAYSLARFLYMKSNLSLYKPLARTLQNMAFASMGRFTCAAEECDEVSVEEAPAHAGNADSSLRVCVQISSKQSLWKGKVASRFEPLFLIDCVICSADFRDVAKLTRVAARINMAQFGESGNRLNKKLADANFKWPSAPLLRWSRVRFDLTCSMFSRITCADRLGPNIFREVMFDASPQFGREILAVIEIILTFQLGYCNAPTVTTRLLFTVNLAHKHCSAPDKGMALMWSVFLHYGT